MFEISLGLFMCPLCMHVHTHKCCRKKNTVIKGESQITYFQKLMWHFHCTKLIKMSQTWEFKRHFLNDILLLAITVASVVSCPDYFSHRGGKNSLVNGIFCKNFYSVTLLHLLGFCSKVLVTSTIFWLPQLHSFCVHDTYSSRGA